MGESYSQSKEAVFFRWLDGDIEEAIQAAKSRGYTADQAIELVKLWELLKAFDGIEAGISMLH